MPSTNESERSIELKKKKVRSLVVLAVQGRENGKRGVELGN